MRFTDDQHEDWTWFKAQVATVNPRARVVRDSEGWPMVPGRMGQVETALDRTLLAVLTTRRVVDKLLAIPGVRRHQMGDNEARMRFPADDPACLRAVFSAARFRATRTGLHEISGRIDCILELKAITVDHVPKLRNFTPGIPWPLHLDKKLRRVSWQALERGDRQIRDFRRILDFPAARGVTVIVNEGSPSLTPEMVVAFLGNTMRELQHTDAVVYLSDRSDRSHASIIRKRSDDDTLRHFEEEFFMMPGCVDWNAEPPILRGGPYPELAFRIEMDDESRSIYRTWSTGWRTADDPTPIPTPRPRVHIIRRDQYRSGLL